MPAERFYIQAPLASGNSISLEDQEFHHLVRVMRGKPGDSVELINGQGALANAIIKQVNKRDAVLEITDVTTTPKPAFEVILAQGIPRGNRLDFILEKGTELGMTQLWLFPGDRSERKEFTENNQERTHTLMVSALKQCGSLWLPELHIKGALKKWSSLPYPAFFGDVAESAPRLLDCFKKDLSGVILLIGPESGLSDQEEAKLVALGAKGVKLHSHILRTDTAAIAALTLLTH